MIDIDKLMDEIPFGNTEFQIRNFTDSSLNENDLPGRKLRYHLLQYRTKKHGLAESKIRFKKALNKIDHFSEKSNSASNEYKKRKYLLKVEMEKAKIEQYQGLIKDSEREIQIHLEEIEKIGFLTRDQFEQNEYDYWKDRLIQEAKCQIISVGTIQEGTIKALDNIGIRIRRNGNQLLFPSEIENKLLDY
tara:strand:- start:205 stop:774 length:570 start_codon:yes stop_codon:yes gene_type:complete